jgi:hypothetical protein
MTQASDATGPVSGLEEVAARAARLGITPERVLQEYAYIAFADLRHIVRWGEKGLELMQPEALSEADAAPIAEISADSADAGHYRVKLYDKKAALDAIARHLGMFPSARPPRGGDKDQPAESAEDPREVLERLLDRLVANAPEEEVDRPAEPGPGRDAGP